jgi:hypothetical protein
MRRYTSRSSRSKRDFTLGAHDALHWTARDAADASQQLNSARPTTTVVVAHARQHGSR